MKDFVKKITKEAGEELLASFKKEKSLVSLRQKSKEVVTKYDKAIDLFLIKEISKKYPRHSILTEESGLKEKDPDYLWIVDSLDGSGNFANKNPLFSVCVALLYKKELILGTTYAPAIDEFYWAEKKKGAFLNGKKIKVSSTTKAKDSYVLFCDGHEKNRKKLSKKLSDVFQKVIDLRKIGSAGIETGWVASGKADVFLVFQGDPWDIASGTLIVKEAGGKVSDFKGNPWQNKRGDFIFSNKKTHQAIRKILNQR